MEYILEGAGTQVGKISDSALCTIASYAFKFFSIYIALYFLSSANNSSATRKRRVPTSEQAAICLYVYDVHYTVHKCIGCYLHTRRLFLNRYNAFQRIHFFHFLYDIPHETSNNNACYLFRKILQNFL